MRNRHVKPLPIIIRYGHHIVFAVSILLMASLITWWSIFISNSIAEQYNLQMKLLINIVKSTAGKSASILSDERIEKVHTRNVTPVEIEKSIAIEAEDGYYLRIRPAVIEEIERNLRSKRLMVAGESVFLFIMLTICCFLLYRFISINRALSRQAERFWQSITHELKTPITGIKIFLQSLQRGAFREQDIDQYLKLAIEQVYSQEKMAENLIAGATMGTGQQFFPSEEFEITTFLRTYTDNYKLLNHNLSLNTIIPEQQVILFNSPDAIRLILNNLLDNSRKYAGNNPQITMTLTEEKHSLTLKLEDNGPGLPAGILEQFSSRRKNNMLNGHGAGIGLIISSELAERNNGELRISNNSKGAVFELKLKM